MTGRFIGWLAICLSAALCVEVYAADEAHHGRALSLRMLSRLCAEHPDARELPLEARTLGGITWIHGFIVVPDQQDVILFGEVEEGCPPLQLDDFVVALRNADLQYAKRTDDTIYWQNPGCTIDPDPNVLIRLKRVMAGNGTADSADKQAVIDRWAKVCESPQSVGVFGVPFDSHFANVMVQADYDMKLLADGNDAPPVPGLISYMSLNYQRAVAEIGSDSDGSSQGLLDRFWFYPGVVSYVQTSADVALETCQVVLLTEAEVIARSGETEGTGQANPLAKQFADSLTESYDNLTAHRPIYRELESLFRFVALAKILKQENSFAAAQLNADGLLRSYRVNDVKVERQLPGRWNVREYNNRYTEGSIVHTHSLLLPCCGGVDIDINKPDRVSVPARLDQLADTRHELIKSRSGPETLSWPSQIMIESASRLRPTRLFTGEMPSRVDVSTRSNFETNTSGAARRARDWRK